MTFNFNYTKKLITIFTVSMNMVLAANLFYEFKNEGIVVLIISCYSLLLISLVVADFKSIEIGSFIKLKKGDDDDDKN